MGPVYRKRKASRKLIAPTYQAPTVCLPYDTWTAALDESGLTFQQWRAELPPNFLLDLPF